VGIGEIVPINLMPLFNYFTGKQKVDRQFLKRQIADAR
jgi:hypothetical protein